jgi:hypothetical protein
VHSMPTAHEFLRRDIWERQVLEKPSRLFFVLRQWLHSIFLSLQSAVYRCQ